MRKLTLPILLAVVAFGAASCDEGNLVEMPEWVDAPNVSTNPVFPTGDQMEEILPLPATVRGNDFDALGQAFLSRLAMPQNGIDATTMVAVFDTDAFMDNPESQDYKDAMIVLERGGVLIFANPTSEVAQGADMYGFSKSGNYCFLQSSDAVNVERIELVTDPVDSTVSQKVLPPGNDLEKLNGYELGLRADVLAKWAVEECYPLKNSNSDDFTAQKVHYSYYVTNGTIETKTRNKAHYEVTYFITPVYSFDRNEDYYIVHQEVIGDNSPVKDFYWETKLASTTASNYYAGFELGEYETESWLKDSAGKDIVRSANEIHNISPQTTQSTITYNTGMSFNIGGSVGTTSASISTGFSYSSTNVITIPDVTTLNRVYQASGIKGSDGNLSNAFWTYDVRKRESKWQLVGMGFTDPPHVAVNGITLHQYWYWSLKPSAKNAKYQMYTRNSICFTHTHAYMVAPFYTDSDNYTSGLRFTHVIPLEVPLRVKD